LAGAVFVFAACGQSGSSGQKAAAVKDDFSKHVEFEIVTAPFGNMPLAEDMLIMKELANRTNTVVHFTNIPATEYNTKIQTLVAANQLPDLVLGNSVSNETQMFEDGVFLYLNDYVSQTLTPNLYKIMQDYPDYAKEIKDDNGRIRYFGQLFFRLWNMNWLYSSRMAEAAGVQAPTDIDSLYAYLKAIKAKYADSYPLGVGPWSGGLDSVKRPLLWLYDTDNTWRMYDSEQYLFGPIDRQSAYKDGLKYINKLYQEKLIDPEFFSRTDDDAVALFHNDRVAFFYSWTDGLLDWAPGEGAGIEILPNPPLKGVDGKARVGSNSIVVRSASYIATKACKDINRFLAWTDYIYGPEGTVLLNWGIEDDTFVTVNGKKQYTDKVMKSEISGDLARYQLGLVNPFFPCVWESEPEDLLNGKYIQEVTEIYKASAMFPANPGLVPMAEETETVAQLEPDIGTIRGTYEARLIQESPASFDATFNEYIQKLKDAGVDRYIATVKGEFARYLKR
jgi:putative aldouronate transport system substrate-binding protein